MTKQEAVSKLLGWAAKQVGYHEGAGNYNKYAEDVRLQKLYGWNAQMKPWCDLFTDEAFVDCFGLQDGAAMTYQPIGKGSAACRTSASYFAEHNAFVQQPEAGDVVFFYDSERVINHQGLVEKISGGVVYTIEGNKSDGVNRCAYALSSGAIAGYGRPKWSVVCKEQANEPVIDDVKVEDLPTAKLPTLKRGMVSETVRAAQSLLNTRGASCGKYGADGDFGPATEGACRAFQSRNNLEPDGIIGPVTWAALLGVA